MSVPDRDPRFLRASDADREAVADRLRDALTEGRLDIDEYRRRLDEAFAATTQAQLEPLTSDLPVAAGATEPAVSRKRALGPWREWLGVAIILNTIWAITSLAAGEPIFYWPMFPLGIWGAVILAGSLFFGDDDDEG